MEQSKSRLRRVVLKKQALLAIVVIALIGTFRTVETMQAKKQTAGDQASVTTTATPSPSAAPSPLASSVPSATSAPTVVAAKVSAAGYRDGTYSATIRYHTPETTESLGVSLTLSGDKVSAATVTSGAEDPKSKRYQGLFISEYKPFVVGQPIDSLQVDRVGGASLTSRGFNAALMQIKAQAKA